MALYLSVATNMGNVHIFDKPEAYRCQKQTGATVHFGDHYFGECHLLEPISYIFKVAKKNDFTLHVWFSKSVGIHFSFVYIMRMLKMCLPTCHRKVNGASGKCIFVSV
jgi:hypothetical protein